MCLRVVQVKGKGEVEGVVKLKKYKEGSELGSTKVYSKRRFFLLTVT